MHYHITSARHYGASALEDLEFACFRLRSWTGKEIRRFLDDPRNGGLVAIRFGDPIGHLLWSFNVDRREVLVERIGVLAWFRWPSIARQLLSAMLCRTTPPSFVPRLTWRTIATDDRLDYHLLLRDLGFRAIRIFREYLPGVDAYDFQRSSDPAPAPITGAWPCINEPDGKRQRKR